jgi:hypothetical protein
MHSNKSHPKMLDQQLTSPAMTLTTGHASTRSQKPHTRQQHAGPQNMQQLHRQRCHAQRLLMCKGATS